MIVQDSRRTPTSGKIVTSLGSYDPHAKTLSIDTERATQFLNNGAQPSPRVVSLLSKEGVKMPSWVKVKATDRTRSIKNLDKLRKNQPVVAAEEAIAEDIVEEVVAEEAAEEVLAEEIVEEAVAEEVVAETAVEKPAA
jgi:ribosomal protein S16